MISKYTDRSYECCIHNLSPFNQTYDVGVVKLAPLSDLPRNEEVSDDHPLDGLVDDLDCDVFRRFFGWNLREASVDGKTLDAADRRERPGAEQLADEVAAEGELSAVGGSPAADRPTAGATLAYRLDLNVENIQMCCLQECFRQFRCRLSLNFIIIN